MGIDFHRTDLQAIMLPTLEFTEALKDSPRLRESVAAHDLYFTKLDAKMNELLKHISSLADFGKECANAFKAVSVTINELRQELMPQDKLLIGTFSFLSEAFDHVASLHKTLIEEAYTAVYENINSFLKVDRAKIAETKLHFENLSSSLDEALSRKAVVPRSRPNELVDATNALTAIGTCFAHTYIDYIAQITIAHAHKDHLILNVFWSLIKEYNSFFSHGHSFFDEWTSIENGCVSETVSTLSMRSKKVERKMQERHTLVPKEVFLHPTVISPEDDVVMEGYLFKRATNAFKTWHRRWFQIKDNQLVYTHRSVPSETPTVMEPDLKLCLVRAAPPSVDRFHCFELVTPTRSHLLQADSETLCNAWIRALQRTIHHLHETDDNFIKQASISILDNKVSHNLSYRESLLNELKRIPGNDVCADCNDQSPKWASINLGALLCIECCAIHRSFGVQISKIRSLTMDVLESEQRRLLLTLGNKFVNSIYLAHLPENRVVPLACDRNSPRFIREAWIRAKYIEKRFIQPCIYRVKNSAFLRTTGEKSKLHSSSSTISSRRCSLSNLFASIKCATVDNENFSPTSKSIESSSCGSDTDLKYIVDTSVVSDDKSDVMEAAESGNISRLYKLLAKGVNVNGVYNYTTTLHIAAKNGNNVIAEFLLLNGAKVNAVDGSLNTPLHLAASGAHTLVVCQLMKRGADQRAKNAHGETPLDVAVEGKHADIVTLLRIQRMRDEFSDEFNNPMDETVDHIMLDISRKVDPTIR